MGGFARIFIFSFVVWMIGLIVLLFRELFNNEEFQFQKYLQKIWKVFLFAFEWSAYGGILVGPLLMISSKSYLTYGMVTIDSILLSLLYYNLRRRIGGKGTRKAKQKQ